MLQKGSVHKKNNQTQLEDVSYIGQLFAGSLPVNNNPSDSTQNQQDFYEQYKRVLGISHEIKKQLHHQSQLKEQLIEKIEELEKNMNSNIIMPSVSLQRKDSMKKRSRRMADEIERKHKCNAQFCEKQYGSEGSLIQHIKLKHPQLYYPNNT